MASLSVEPKTPLNQSSVARTGGSETIGAVAEVLGQSLLLAPDVTAELSADTLLFGNLPELDSMAVATVLTALEDRFGILIDDDEVSGELFETVGSLAAFIRGKLDAAGNR
jgi:acyl carrier protein